MMLDARSALWLGDHIPPSLSFCDEPPAALWGTAIQRPRPDMVQAPEARHGIKIRLINWMVYDHRIRD
jgi:hypothetical protein